MLRLVLFLGFIGASYSLCPKKYELTRNGECYRQYKAAEDADAGNAPNYAVSYCKDDKALPVIIRNQEDQDYWWSVAKKDKKKGEDYGNLILGMVCDKKHNWQWADGSEVTFRPEKYDVDVDQPCHDNGYHYCTIMIEAKTGKWKAVCNEDVTIDIYCTIVPPPPALTQDKDCADFAHDDDDNVCYQVADSPANLTEANTVCKSFGANIASVHNSQENSFIRRLASSKGLLNGILLGSNKKNGWIDGSKWDYDNFAPGFPIDGLGDCLAMETNNVGGQWLNLDCSTELPFACIRKPSAAEPGCDGVVHKEGEIIFSPGFPFNSSTPCDFTLMVDAGKLVEVEILLLEANSCCDHLVITEGVLGGAVLADLTGDKNDGKKFTTKTQNSMRVSWQPNGAINVRGMMITFRGVPK